MSCEGAHSGLGLSWIAMIYKQKVAMTWITMIGQEL
jgi:hypothetical protein